MTLNELIGPALIVINVLTIWFLLRNYKRKEEKLSRELFHEGNRKENTEALKPILDWCFNNIKNAANHSDGTIIFVKCVENKEVKLYITPLDKLCFASYSYKINKGIYKDLKAKCKSETNKYKSKEKAEMLQKILNSCQHETEYA